MILNQTSIFWVQNAIFWELYSKIVGNHLNDQRLRIYSSELINDFKGHVFTHLMLFEVAPFFWIILPYLTTEKWTNGGVAIHSYPEIFFASRLSSFLMTSCY